MASATHTFTETPLHLSFVNQLQDHELQEGHFQQDGARTLTTNKNILLSSHH